MIANPQPGDVLAVIGGGVGGWLIGVGQAMAGKPVLGTHVVVITHQDVKGRWIGIQGEPGGVALCDVTPYLTDDRVRSNNRQPRLNDNGQLTAFLAGCAKSLGLPYDWVGIADDIAGVLVPDLSAEIGRLWRWPDPASGLLPGHVVCSSLAAMLYELPAVSWKHPDLGKERLCTPADWWEFNDMRLWS